MPLVHWIKNHKLVTVLILFILFLLFIIWPQVTGVNTFSYKSPSSTSTTTSEPSTNLGNIDSFESSGIPFTNLTPKLPSFGSNKQTNTTERITVKNSNISLLVKDVKESGEKILSYTKDQGGYMVEVSYNRPLESPFGTITVRIPTEKLDEALKYFRGLGIKVTSENLTGTDVTDQYTDIEANLTTLEKTKSKFEAFLDKATTLTESVNIEREIITLQQQVDSYKGARKALEENASLTKITLYLSTDELALPYTPDQTFRPQVIFKQAVRSLLNSLRIIGQVFIWVIVYSVIWIPIVAGYLLYKRMKAKRAQVH